MFGRLFGKDRSSAPDAAAAAARTMTRRLRRASARQPAESYSRSGSLRPRQNGWFQRLRQGLSKTSTQLTEGITGVFTKRKLDAATLEEFEDLLIHADLGIDTASRIVERLVRRPLRQGNLAGSRQRDPRR